MNYNSATCRAMNLVSSASTRVATVVAGVRTAGVSIDARVSTIARTDPLLPVIEATRALRYPVREAPLPPVAGLPALINADAHSSPPYSVKHANELDTRPSIVTCWPSPFSSNATNNLFRMSNATLLSLNGSHAGRNDLDSLPVPHARSCTRTVMR